MQEIQVRFLSWEDPLENGMAIHSGILAWEMLWTEEPGGLRSVESQRVGHVRMTNTFIFPSVKWNSNHITYVESKKNDANELRYKTEIDSQA